MNRFPVRSDPLPLADFINERPSSLLRPMLSKYMLSLVMLKIYGPMSL